MITTTDLVLTGARAGQTAVLNNKQFVRGVIRLRGSHEQLEPVIQYYGRTYAAFPDGSPALAAAQKQDAETKRAANGQHNPDPVSRLGTTDALRSAGTDDVAGADPSAQPANLQPGANAAQAGGTGVRPNRDGHEHTGLRPGQEPKQQQHAATCDLTALRAVVLDLDPGVPENWSTDGKPTVEAVATAMNNPAITRKEIDAAAGDWNHDQAVVRKMTKAKG